MLQQFGIYKIYIPKVQNSTPYTTPDSIVTEAIIESFGGRKDLVITNNKNEADGMLKIKVNNLDISEAGDLLGTSSTGLAGSIPIDRLIATSYAITLNVNINLIRFYNLDTFMDTLKEYPPVNIGEPPIEGKTIYVRSIAKSRNIKVPLNDTSFRDANGIALEGQLNQVISLIAKDISDQAKNEIYDIF